MVLAEAGIPDLVLVAMEAVVIVAPDVLVETAEVVVRWTQLHWIW